VATAIWIAQPLILDLIAIEILPVLVCVLVPHLATHFHEVIRRAAGTQERTQFPGNRFEWEFFCCDSGEPLCHVVPNHCARNGDGVDAGAIGLTGSFRQDFVQQIQVFLHVISFLVDMETLPT